MFPLLSQSLRNFKKLQYSFRLRLIKLEGDQHTCLQGLN